MRELIKAIKNSKALTAILGFLAVSVIGWGIWVTNTIFAGDKGDAVAKTIVEGLCEDMKEAKMDIKGIKDDLDVHRLRAEDRHREILTLLLKMSRDKAKKD